MKYKVKFISIMLVFALLSMLMPLNLFAETLEKTELDFAEEITEIDKKKTCKMNVVHQTCTTKALRAHII